MLKRSLSARIRTRRRLLRHWSRFAPMQPRQAAYAASLHRHHELLCTATATFCSQSGSNMACWKPQVWWNESRCLPFQKTGCSFARCAGSLSCLKTKNSPRMTGSSWWVCSTSPLIFTPGSTDIRSVSPTWTRPQTRPLLKSESRTCPQQKFRNVVHAVICLRCARNITRFCKFNYA